MGRAMKTQNIILLILFTLFVTACGNPISKEQLLNKYTDSASKFIQVQGNRVHYKDEGQNNKDTLVLIHGTASSLHTWDLWTPKLTQHFRVIRFDLPGFGLTGPDKLNRYEITDDIAFLNSFLQKLNINKAHLIGSSLGGRIAWEYSIKYPKQVASLTLINALGYPQESWPPAIQLAMLPGMETLMPKLSSRFVFSQSLNDIYFNKSLITDKTIDRYFELSLYPGNAEAFPKRVKAKLDDQANKIKQITTPTLVLWGEEDEYFPPDNAKRFATDIPRAVVKLYNNVGHLPMEEIPEQSSYDTINFIQSTLIKGTDQTTPMFGQHE